MQGYVITIKDNERSVQAAKRCIKSGKTYGIDIEMHTAITPKDKPDLLLKEKNINPIGFDEVYSRLPNCQAAFLSHYSLWEKCAFHNETFLILEHDAVIVNALPANLNFMHCMPIGKPSYGKFNTPSIFGANPLTQKEYFGGAHAYLLKPSGAWALMEQAQVNARPTDVFLNIQNFPWLQELYPWVAEARDNFTTIQNPQGCSAKHQYNETYRIENV